MPMDFRICNALKIKPFQALLRNAPFCSLGEVGGAGAEPPQNLTTAAAVVQTVKGLRMEIFSRPLRKNTTRPLTVWIVGTDMKCGLLSAGRCDILWSAI